MNIDIDFSAAHNPLGAISLTQRVIGVVMERGETCAHDALIALQATASILESILIQTNEQADEPDEVTPIPDEKGWYDLSLFPAPADQWVLAKIDGLIPTTARRGDDGQLRIAATYEIFHGATHWRPLGEY